MITTVLPPNVFIPPFVGLDLKKVTPRRLSLAAVSHLRLELSRSIAVSTFGHRGELNDQLPSTSGRSPIEAQYIEFPTRQSAEWSKEKPPLVRVRLSVHYRVHSRQMLCIGGSQIPFGWSFLSIAKVPMEWNGGDVWTTEVSQICLQLNFMDPWSDTP